MATYQGIFLYTGEGRVWYNVRERKKQAAAKQTFVFSPR